MLATFIHRYVDTADPGDPRFASLVRALVDERPEPGDREALAELRRDAEASQAFSVYLRASAHDTAIVTLTEEGDLVLGLTLDGPVDDAEVLARAAKLMAGLKEEFQAAAGVAGVELAPPQSASEWQESGLGILHDGQLERG
ncbi:hypothetical protein [Antribacter gilvus]|uniref:hypothetical protein n=1 Tax=Antribacter gilvus TaxID=2304675 RepID=UPI000F7AB7D4|nr:hypothetical protein [Antribacter gilvus]